MGAFALLATFGAGNLTRRRPGERGLVRRAPPRQAGAAPPPHL